MIFVECRNGEIGESYVRVYVWADTLPNAERLAVERFKRAGLPHNVFTTTLFSDVAASFVTDPSDSGFDL